MKNDTCTENRRVRKEGGFALLSVIGALAGLSVILGALAPVFIRRVEEEHVRKAVREMRIIQDAAKEYYLANNFFPENLQELKNSGFLSSLWEAKDPWGEDYLVSGDADGFSVAAAGIPSEYHGLVSAAMPFVHASGGQISSSVPVPGREAAMEPVVQLSGDDSRRTINATLRTRSLNTEIYYFDLETGMMRINDWYVEEMSSQPDGSKKGMWIGEYQENITISVER